MAKKKAVKKVVKKAVKKVSKAKGAAAITKKEIEEMKPPEIKDLNEVYKDGTLLLLRFKQWLAKSTLTKDTINNEFTEEDKSLIKVRSSIIDKDSMLGDILKVRSQIISEVHKWSVEFPIFSVRYVKVKHILRLNAYLEQQTKVYWEVVERFADSLFASNGVLEKFALQHPKLYDLAVKNGAYPANKQEVMNKYSFSYSWKKLSLPNGEDTVFTPEMMEAEVAKAKREINEMKEMTMETVKQSFMERISSLVKQCANEKVNAKSVNSWDKWLVKFDDVWSDFVWRPDLKKVIEDVRKEMKKVSSDRLKGDEAFRKEVGSKLEIAVKTIELLPDIKPKRSFDL